NAKMKRLIAIAFGMVATVWLSVANADLLYTAGSGTTLFDFVCFSTKHCPVHVNVNSAGTELGTTSNPFVIDTPASGNLYTAVVGAVPWLSITAWDTTSAYTTGTTNAGSSDLHGAPWIDMGAWAGTKLGAPSNYGTTPGTVAV